MKIKIYIDGEEVDIIPEDLIPVLEKRVEVQLSYGLAPFDKELSEHLYTINISFPHHFQYYSIYTEGLPYELSNSVEHQIHSFYLLQPEGLR